jgi:hypothetical protein
MFGRKVEKIGKLENWKIGKLENWKIGIFSRTMEQE